MNEPKTLLEAIQYFSDSENCRQFMIAIRWLDGVVRCPYCGNDRVSYLENAKLYFCPNKHAKQKFSLKVGTIFEDSAIPLQKWLPAAWLIANCKNGISSYEVARAIGLTQKSAWFVLHRLREAMQNDPLFRMGGSDGGPIEVDETFIGGRIKNMHRSAVRRKFKGMSVASSRITNKAIVIGMRDRETR